MRHSSHLFLLAGLLLAAACPQSALGQAFGLPVAPSLEAGMGISRLEWEKDIPRPSYLPEVTLSLVAPTTFSTQTILEPTLGLHLDGVRYESFNGYQDHYLVTSVRVGLVALAQSHRRPEGGPFVAGFGLEARRPMYVRAHAYSRIRGEARAWVSLPDPSVLDQWGFYWILRTGMKYQRFAMLLDATFNTGERALLSLIPANPLRYLNFRLSVRTPL